MSIPILASTVLLIAACPLISTSSSAHAFLTIPATTTQGFTSYDNAFIPPAPILDRYLNKNDSNHGAGTVYDTESGEETILAWADFLNAQGPSCMSYRFPDDETLIVGFPAVMNKTILPLSGDKHDYMSWAP